MTYAFAWVDVTHSEGRVSRFGQPAADVDALMPEIQKYVECYGAGSTFAIVEANVSCSTCNGDGFLVKRQPRSYKRVKCPDCKAIDSRIDVTERLRLA